MTVQSREAHPKEGLWEKIERTGASFVYCDAFLLKRNTKEENLKKGSATEPTVQGIRGSQENFPDSCDTISVMRSHFRSMSETSFSWVRQRSRLCSG